MEFLIKKLNFSWSRSGNFRFVFQGKGALKSYNTIPTKCLMFHTQVPIRCISISINHSDKKERRRIQSTEKEKIEKSIRLTVNGWQKIVECNCLLRLTEVIGGYRGQHISLPFVYEVSRWMIPAHHIDLARTCHSLSEAGLFSGSPDQLREVSWKEKWQSNSLVTKNKIDRMSRLYEYISVEILSPRNVTQRYTHKENGEYERLLTRRVYRLISSSIPIHKELKSILMHLKYPEGIIDRGFQRAACSSSSEKDRVPLCQAIHFLTTDNNHIFLTIWSACDWYS